MNDVRLGSSRLLALSALGDALAAVRSAIGVATDALGDVAFRQRLFNASSRALQTVEGGKGIELRFVMRALEKMGL